MSKFTTALKNLENNTVVNQSVYFKAYFRYDRFPVVRGTEELIFDSFEKMILTYRQARRRRAIADRPTAMSYELIKPVKIS
tara:strand:+ start:1381 stop:1623 length:243 start_codon:yes stop_codon:yes gene_type:complete